jgi:hypothetical protein
MGALQDIWRRNETPVARDTGERKIRTRHQRKNVLKPHRGRIRPETGTRGLAAENVHAAGARNCTLILRVTCRGSSERQLLARSAACINGFSGADCTVGLGRGLGKAGELCRLLATGTCGKPGLEGICDWVLNFASTEAERLGDRFRGRKGMRP